MDEWKTIEPNTWKPEVGDKIVGVLVNIEEKEGDLSARYYLENEEGQHLVWGSAILDTRMKLVKIGDKLRITYKELTQNAKKQDLKIMTVEVANPPADKVDSIKSADKTVPPKTPESY